LTFSRTRRHAFVAPEGGWATCKGGGNATRGLEHPYAFHQVLNAPGEKTLSREEYMREWSVEEIARMVFDESPTDMLVAQPLPAKQKILGGNLARLHRIDVEAKKRELGLAS
jgi:hypothetical protein